MDDEAASVLFLWLASLGAVVVDRRTVHRVSILAFVILGSVLEGIPAIVLFGPLLFPIAREMGVHEVHYAMVVVLSMGVGLFAPPFGAGLLTPHASREMGGLGLSHVEKAVVFEEAGYSTLGPTALNIHAPDEGNT